MKRILRAKSLTVTVTQPAVVQIILEASTKSMAYSMSLMADTKNLALKVRAMLDPAYEKLAVALSEFGIRANKAELFDLDIHLLCSLGYMKISFKQELDEFIQPYNLTILPPDGSNLFLRNITSQNIGEVDTLVSERRV